MKQRATERACFYVMVAVIVRAFVAIPCGAVEIGSGRPDVAGCWDKIVSVTDGSYSLCLADGGYGSYRYAALKSDGDEAELNWLVEAWQILVLKGNAVDGQKGQRIACALSIRGSEMLLAGCEIAGQWRLRCRGFLKKSHECIRAE